MINLRVVRSRLSIESVMVGRSIVHVRMLLLWCLLAVLIAVTPASAQNQEEIAVSETGLTRDDRVRQAEMALSAGNYQLVRAQAMQILNRWPRDEDGLILLASAMLFGPNPEPSAANSALRKLPRSTRKRPDIEALDLWRDYRYGISFLPTYRDAMQMKRAKELLEEDPTDAIANLVAGRLRLDQQRTLDGAVRFGIDASSDGGLEFLAMYASSEIDPRTGKPKFEARLSGSPEIQVIWSDDAFNEISTETVRYFIRASVSGHLRAEAIRNLSESTLRAGRLQDGLMVVAEYVGRFPNASEGHRLLGMFQYELGNKDRASIEFEKAIALMTEEEALIWQNPSRVVSRVVESDYKRIGASQLADFWSRQDPRWTTPDNERLTEHMSRMTKVDLLWGRPEEGYRGWETEPGQVIVRYGSPKSYIQFQDEGSRYHVLHYGDRYWYFHDIAKTGKPIFYSPPADQLNGPRPPIGFNDFVLQAREVFRDDPLRTEVDMSNRLPLQVLSSVLRNGDSRVVIAPVCFLRGGFTSQDRILIFDREEGASVPPPAFSTPVKVSDECPNTIITHETDFREREISLEVTNEVFWAAARIDLPHFADEGQLLVSDIVLASDILDANPASKAVPQGAFRRNDLYIFPKVWSSYAQGEHLHLYVEAYGLQDVMTGESLAVQAVVAEGGLNEVGTSLLGRLFGRRENAAVSVQFMDEIVSDSQGRSLILETQDLAPGTYTLAIRMTESSTGRQAVSRREIVIESAR